MQRTIKARKQHVSDSWLKKCVLFCVIVFCALWGTSAYADVPESEKGAVYVLAFTDFHGRLQEGKEDPGIAKFMGAVRAFQATHPHTLLLAAGDLFTGTQESDMLRGAPTFAAMRAIDLAASAVGNHEFDWERSDILQWQQGGLHFLSANVKDAQGNLPSGIEDGRIFTVGGMRVGVVGLTATSTARTTKQHNVGHLVFAPPVEALAPVVSQLRKEGAEVVIVLAHLAGKQKKGWKDGIAPIIRKIAQVPGVTVVVSGHSHEEHLAVEGAVPIVQPAYRGRSLAVIEFTRGQDGKVLTKVEIDRISKRKNMLPVDKEGTAIAHKALEDLEPAMQRVVAHAPQDLRHENKGTSPLGQSICQAMLDEVGGEVAILKNSAIHGSLKRGPITEKMFYQLIPLSNRIMQLDMTGAELAHLLETAFDEKEKEGIQLKGLSLTYDAALPQGKRITSMTLENGTVIKPDMTVRVLHAGFPVQGGEGIPFPEVGRNKLLLELRLRDVLRDWLSQKNPA